MSDAAVVALAVAVVAGARLAPAVPMALAIVAVGLAVLVRRPIVVVLAGGLLAAALATAAWAGLAPFTPTNVRGEGVLVDDPVVVHGAVRVELRVGRRHLEAWARGDAAHSLRPRLAGDVVALVGRIRPPPVEMRRRLAARHIVGRLELTRVGRWRPGGAAQRAANAVRRTLSDGADSLTADERSLLLGVVIGDDRDQSRSLADDFRAAGLTHLLAVSGENVAFVLAVASPGLRRMGLGARWAVTILLLGFFGLLTRWEPSVMRAGAMAAIACTSSTLGRPVGRVRLLGLAVTAVVLVDPLLVHSLGFRLSVGATAGIALVAGPLERWLRGPSWFTAALAVTMAAQLGVAPIAVPAFGGLPLAGIPANVLAAPAAAMLTTWGFTGGVLAGMAGRPFAAWLQVPTRLLTVWLTTVAHRCAALPLGQVRLAHLAAGLVAALLVVLVVAAHRRLAGR